MMCFHRRTALCAHLLVGLVVALALGSTSAGQGASWVQNPSNGHWYSLTSVPDTWQAAEAEALSLGGHLASVSDAIENNWIFTTFAQGDNVWIGLKQSACSPQPACGWDDWSTGELVSYTNWISGEPNDNGNEDFAELKGTMATPAWWGLWNDVGTSVQLRGVIEVLGAPPPVFEFEAVDQAVSLCVGSSGPQFGSFEVPLQLTEQNPGSSGAPVQSFSMRLEHNPLVLEATSIVEGFALLSLGPIDFFNPEMCGGTVGTAQLGCVISFSGAVTLDAALSAEVALVTYDILVQPPLSTDLVWQDGPGCGTPPVTNVVVVGGVSSTPQFENGTISIGVDNCFARGRCNPDGLFDIGDPTWLLAYLFSSGSASPCADGCDCNDDNMLDIGDAICMLSWLFVPGSPPPALPFPDCGVDPTGDALSPCTTACP